MRNFFKNLFFLLKNDFDLIIFSEGIQYYSKGVMILTLQGFSAYDIFNVISSDSNIFVRILSGFSLFLKIKDSLFECGDFNLKFMI